MRLTSLAATEGVPDRKLWYFGDIDSAGFRIARMAVGRAEKLGLDRLSPAHELYELCCDVGIPRTTPRSAGDDLAQWTQNWLGGTLGQKVSRIVASGGRIVQETIGVELLATIDPARLFTQ
jgi:hypothetical protein